MRRKEKEITDKSEIERIISKAIVCRISMANDNIPYIVPLCFGYKDNSIYVHCASEGKKTDILHKNSNVCFEIDINSQVIEGDNACNWGMQYQSVIGFGKAFFLEDSEDKKIGLNIIMNHYSNRVFQFSEQSLKKTSVIKIEIESMSGKQSGF